MEKHSYKCPACKHSIEAFLYSGVRAIFCPYCRERIDV